MPLEIERVATGFHRWWLKQVFFVKLVILPASCALPLFFLPYAIFSFVWIKLAEVLNALMAHLKHLVTICWTDVKSLLMIPCHFCNTIDREQEVFNLNLLCPEGHFFCCWMPIWPKTNQSKLLKFISVRNIFAYMKRSVLECWNGFPGIILTSIEITSVT